MKKSLLISLIMILAGVTVSQNNCLDFDASDDYAGRTSPVTTVTDNFTIAAWIKADVIPSNEWRCIAYNGTDGGGFGIGFYNGNLGGLYGVITFHNTGIELETGTWYHVAMIRNGGTTQFILNGKTLSYTNSSAPLTPVNRFTIGNMFSVNNSDLYTTSFDGQIDEVSLWSSALDESAIRMLMYDELAGTETNLIAYYVFDQSTGDLQDITSNNYDCSLTSMSDDDWVPSSAFFGPKNCLDFDGTDDWISSGITMPSSYTKEAWVYIESANSLSNNIVSGGDSDGQHAFWIPLGYSYKLSAGHNGTWNIVQDPNTFPFGSWQHVAVTYESGTMTLYRNGVQVDQATGVAAFTGTTVRIGAYNDNQNILGGKLDEVRIWNDVRSETEIRENMCKSLTGNEPGLIAYYNFDNTSGITLQDMALNDEAANDGTLTNMENNDWVTSSAFNTWLNTSTSSTNWSTASNWSQATVPNGSSQNVGIPDYSAANDPDLSSGITVNNLVVGSNAELDFDAGSHTIHGSVFNIGTTNIEANTDLTITGSLYMLPLSTVNLKSQAALTIENNLDFVLGGGTFNILSNAEGTGSLIVGGSVSHNINTQRYVNVTGKGDKWHYVSSPVSGQTINESWLSTNSITSTPAYQFFRFDEPTNYWIIYNSDGNPVYFNDSEFGAAKGYCLTRSEAGSLSFTGSVRTDATTTYSATYNAETGMGFNLVGNPYTSSVGITADASTTNKFLTVNSDILDDNYEAIYIWDEQADWSNRRDDYKVIGNPVIGSHYELDQDYVQPGQAFMVKVASAGNITFNKDMQAHHNDSYYKAVEEIWPSVELIVQNEELFNSTAIGFKEGMTNGLNPSYDVGKLKGNPNIALYTRLVEDNGVDFAIQALDDKNIENYVIPVGIDVSKETVLEFSISQSNFDQVVYLEDRLLNKSVNLNEQNYSAVINQSGIGRFYVHFAAVGIEENNDLHNIIQISSSGNSVTIINNCNHTGMVRIVNILGQQMTSFELNGISNQKELINLPSGVYIVNVKLDYGGVCSEKVIIR